ncbi:hypothetical protein ACOME3_010636 [Neoechinorhynchus agilis]
MRKSEETDEIFRSISIPLITKKNTYTNEQLLYRYIKVCSMLSHLASRLIGSHFTTASILRNWRPFSATPSRLYAQVRHPAPSFAGKAVLNGEFKEIALSDYQGKYLLVAFNRRLNEFKDINAEVVGVSTDSHFSHLAWTNLSEKQGGVGQLEYPLLSDFNKSISRDYGVLLDTDGIALRGLFVIDPTSVIRHITINDLPVGRSVDEVLRIVKAFQFVETHGEVCPANWSEDKNPRTIKPDPKGSLEYFKDV